VPDFDFINRYFDFFGLTWGVLIIIGAGVLVFLLVAVILERRTKLIFPNRDANGDEDFDFDDDDDDDDEAGAGKDS
jgi:hypothetical protein